MQQSENYIKIILKLLKANDISIERELGAFDNMLLYDAIVYDEAAVMLDTLRGIIGKETFDKGIKLYFEENKFKIATKQTFLKAIQTVAGERAIEIVEAFLKGKVLSA